MTPKQRMAHVLSNIKDQGEWYDRIRCYGIVHGNFTFMDYLCREGEFRSGFPLKRVLAQLNSLSKEAGQAKYNMLKELKMWRSKVYIKISSRKGSK